MIQGLFSACYSCSGTADGVLYSGVLHSGVSSERASTLYPMQIPITAIKGIGTQYKH